MLQRLVYLLVVKVLIVTHIKKIYENCYQIGIKIHVISHIHADNFASVNYPDEIYIRIKFYAFDKVNSAIRIMFYVFQTNVR